MAPKQSKNIGKFDLIIKELKAFGSRINECKDNKSRIRVLKTQVLQYETRLTEIFSELSTHESDESFDIYMKYKDILFNWVVDLEEKSQVEEVNSSIHASIRGDAAKLIRGFAITVDNLKNCWDILCSRQRWELSLENNKIPTPEEFRVFIEREARGLNELKFVKPDIKKGNVKPLNSFNKSNVNTTVVKCNQVKSSVKPDVVKGGRYPVRGLKHTNHKLVSVNETFAETSLCSTNFEFSSCVSSDKFQVKALLVSKVTSAMPNFPIKYHEWPHIKDLTLADPTFYIENEIDILLGADVFMTLISGTPIMGPKGMGPISIANKIRSFIVRDDSSIGDSKEGALKRFYSLERKLHSNNQLMEQYTEFMEEYQNLGHMTPLASDVKSPHYFLPHHGVINDNSSTTKLRVVFDGSFKSTNGNSLNDILLTDDACFQQIFWRKSPEEPLVIFKSNTVTYGTSCAPFVAIRTLKQLCEDEKHRFPQAAKLAKDHFYVDDLLAGADSLDSARKIVHELQNLMSAGGFELRK
ncbi:DUF1758 domain-containing protein [Trichonephila clavipes]|nr:DUF1758 domain-containing protein [Trichonephila clavipes]